MPDLAIVLVEIANPWNIGSAARLLTNFGLHDLRLVGGSDPLHEKSRVLAVNAQHILQSAARQESLDTALADRQISIATTGKIPGDSRHEVHPTELAALIAGKKAALVFGSESDGLTRYQLERCTHWCRIPLPGENSSMNVSKAMAIMLYMAFPGEIRKNPDGEIPASHGEKGDLIAHFLRLLGQADVETRRSLEILFHRLDLSSREIRFLHRILKSIDRISG